MTFEFVVKSMPCRGFVFKLVVKREHILLPGDHCDGWPRDGKAVLVLLPKHSRCKVVFAPDKVALIIIRKRCGEVGGDVRGG